MCAPSTTTSSRRVVPSMVSTTEGWVEQVAQAVNSSVVTSLRPAASAAQLSRIHSADALPRSEEHTSELHSLMRISYAVFCVNKKRHTQDRSTAHINSRH